LYKLPAVFRLIIATPFSGAMNMAIDEALALNIQNSLPIIRFYQFKPICLSIGRFQKIKGIIDLNRIKEDGIDLIRRPSGGMAVYHANSLTYSFILARNHITDFKKRSIYRMISQLFITSLNSMGIKSRFSLKSEYDKNNPDCFHTIGQYEIITDLNRKLVGSAQALTREYCIQQGSIPIDNGIKKMNRYLLHPVENQHSTFINRELKKGTTYKKIVTELIKSFSLIFSLKTSNITEEEYQLALNIKKLKYNNKEWNFRY
jgi:lipoate-protein ligase A